MSVTLRPYRDGGWEVDITVRLPDGSALSRAETRVPLLEVGGSTMGAGPRAASAAARPARSTRGRCQHSKHSRRDSLTVTRGRTVTSRAALPRRIDPEVAPGSGARCEASRRDHERTGAASEARAGESRAEDREQRADGAEHAAEEGGGMGRARAAAVHDQVAAESQEDDGVSRLRSVRAAADGRAKTRCGGVPDGAVGR